MKVRNFVGFTKPIEENGSEEIDIKVIADDCFSFILVNWLDLFAYIKSEDIDGKINSEKTFSKHLEKITLLYDVYSLNNFHTA